MSICYSVASITGEHRMEWVATLDGGGYWRCVNANCGETEQDGTGHHGG